MNTCMTFPKTIDEFIESYQFVDRKEIYTNGSELIPVFRVQQAIEHYLPKWISVKERLPEAGKMQLVCARKYAKPILAFRSIPYPGEAFHESDPWITDQFEKVEVTHWMPLPEPPEAKG